MNRRLLVLLALLLTAACRSELPAAPPAAASPDSAVASSTTTSTPTLAPTHTLPPPATFTPPPILTATPPPPTPLPSPSPTPPPALLAVPPDRVSTTAAALQAANLQSRWTIVENNTETMPAAAAAALLPNQSGTLISQQPLVLAVPLFTDWEMVSRSEADRIIQEGHPIVTVQLWESMTPDQKALRIDGVHPSDPLYPLQERLSFVADGSVESDELYQILQQTFAPAPTVHIAAVGDLMLARGLGIAITAGAVAYPFAQVAPWLQEADFTVGNMESALGNTGEPQPKSYPFQAPPAAADALALAGFDLVSLANNHALDYGPAALLEAISLLQTAGVVPVGAGADAAAAHAPHLERIHGIDFAFLAYVNVPIEVSGFDTASWTAAADTPGLAWGTPERITVDVAAIRPAVDHVIVLLHSGYEYVEPPSEAQLALSRAAIDAGASLVIGHHAHLLQGIEFYGEGIIAYGLGNFAFEIDGPPETAVLDIYFQKEQIREIGIKPAIIQFGGQPRPASAEEAVAIRQQIARLSTYFGPTPPFP